VNLREHAVARASSRESAAEELSLSAPKRLLSEIRAYLIARQDDGHPGTNLHQALKFRNSTDETTINLGPTIDKGNLDGHFTFRSGARLSFGVTVRDCRQASVLVAYRFDYRDKNGFQRFDLNAKPHTDPLREPRAHLHPGQEDIRIPTPHLSPMEVLDILFVVIEPTDG
jgi:hypothetical protein